MSNFSIGLSDNNIIVNISESMGESDIEQMLSFDEENIEELLKTHAAKQAYWEALAVRLQNRYELFKEEWVKKWWAHHKTFAKMVLAAYGESKPTMDAIKDMVILIFSEETSDIEREKYCNTAYQIAEKKKDSTSKTDFQFSMFRYINNGWAFEQVQRTESKLEEQYKMVEIVAERLNSRSFHMQSLIELLKAKKFNIEPRMGDAQVHNAFNKAKNNE